MHTLQKLLILLKSKDIKVSAKGESLVVDAPPGVLDNELAEEIRKHKSELISLFSNHQTDNKIIPTTNKARIALSAGQRRIWELAQLNPGSSQYNIPTVFKVIGRLDLAQLIKSVEKVCDNNRIFQNCIVNSQNDGAPLIKQVESFKMPYRHVDINELITKNDDVDRVARKYCDDFTQENFEFKDNLPLWRWTTVRVNDDCHYIAFVMHHIIFDGLSKVIIRSI
jgi:hypothetical protein